MIGMLIAAGIPLGAFLLSRASNAPARRSELLTEDQIFGPRTTPSQDPPMLTEDQIFGKPRTQPAPSKPTPPAEQAIAKAPPSSMDEDEQAAPPAPTPAPPPDVEEEPVMQSAPPPVVMQPAPSSPSAQSSQQQRTQAMLEELRAIASNPTADALERLRDPANRAAIELALTMVASADPSLVALIRRLMEPLPSREDMERVAVPPSSPEPEPTPQATPTPPPEAPSAAPSMTAPPPGYDPAKARRIAKEVAANIERNKYSYSRKLVTDFQRFAGIDADADYGGLTRSALRHFGVLRPPRALFPPTADQPYPWA